MNTPSTGPRYVPSQARTLEELDRTETILPPPGLISQTSMRIPILAGVTGVNLAVFKRKTSKHKKSRLEDRDDMLHADKKNKTEVQLQETKPYKCTFPGCNKSFSTSGHLSRHNTTHLGIKPFHCPIERCNDRFIRKDNMVQHYR